MSDWTIDTLKALLDEREASQCRFDAERDRRITEVGIEREKALKIKETADLTALSLARDIQVYKDEKANELRSQIERERGTYATKDDLAALADKLDVSIKSLAGTRRQGLDDVRVAVLGASAVVGVATSVILALTR